jgi:hypothetical protein
MALAAMSGRIDANASSMCAEGRLAGEAGPGARLVPCGKPVENVKLSVNCSSRPRLQCQSSVSRYQGTRPSPLSSVTNQSSGNRSQTLLFQVAGHVRHVVGQPPGDPRYPQAGRLDDMGVSVYDVPRARMGRGHRQSSAGGPAW